MAATQSPGHFEQCVATGGTAAGVLRQVELDLPRTFPRNAWVAGPEGQAALRRVLLGYAAHNPGVGYCQGMNFLVALLLLAGGRDAERAFWLLAALLEGGLLYPGIYAPSLAGCHVEMRTLGDLVAAKLGRLHAHLQDLGCEMSLVATDWFLCLYCTSLPSETAARVLDATFYEGAKVLHRVGLALLGQHQGRARAKDNAGEVLKAIKEAAAHEYNRDALMAAAFQQVGSLPRKKLDALRAAQQALVDAEAAARAAARRKMELKQAISAAQRLQDEHFEQEVKTPTIHVEGGEGAAAGGAAGAGGGSVQERAEQLAQSAAAAAQQAAASVRQRLARITSSAGAASDAAAAGASGGGGSAATS